MRMFEPGECAYHVIYQSHSHRIDRGKKAERGKLCVRE